MKLLMVLLIASASALSLFRQNSNPFKIEVINAGRSDRKSARDFKRTTAAFYEDESFSVSKSCMGEFGGTLIFNDKVTGILYGCSATCPVIINKLKDHYIVTNTLAHMAGSSEILEIDNPRALTVLHCVGRKKNQAVALQELAKTGTKSIIDSIGVLTLGSFPFKGQLYHIITDFKKTFLAEIRQSKFVSLAPIADFRMWAYDPEMIKTDNGHYIFFYKNGRESGYLDVHENVIRLFRY